MPGWAGPLLSLENTDDRRIVWLSIALPGCMVEPGELALRPGESAMVGATGVPHDEVPHWRVQWRFPDSGLDGVTALVRFAL